MLDRLEISGIHTDLDKKVKLYAKEKIGGLDKYIPKHAKKSAHAEVNLKEHKTRGRKFVCKVIMHLPVQTLTVHEEGSTFEEAIDLAEAKLKTQIIKYKDMHTSSKPRRLLLKRFIR
ncbi:MAG TPA: HPF/RaiA family ribosome-associated protein [Candidatus Saccharimonadales bacterium]|nr:HPF/RaiA family ribosome-associated protein [Candidatus Saccharimonadales bacterium]